MSRQQLFDYFNFKWCFLKYRNDIVKRFVIKDCLKIIKISTRKSCVVCLHNEFVIKLVSYVRRI